MAEAVLEFDQIEHLVGCCALKEVHGMRTEIPEGTEDQVVEYEPGKAHTAVTNSEAQDEVEVKLMKQGFRQIANWNNKDGVRLNMWFRGPKNHVMKPFPRPPRAPATPQARRVVRRRPAR